MIATFARGEPVRNRVIAGPDLLSIVTSTAERVRVEDSIIEDGLAFERQPGPIAASEIAIVNSLIRAAPVSRALSTGYSLYAPGTEFPLPLAFSTSTFEGPVRLSDAVFRKGVEFQAAEFASGADLSNARFDAAASFERTKFTSGIDLSYGAFMGNVSFADGEIGGAANFNNVQFAGTASFDSVRFNAAAMFEGARFAREARFGGAQFADRAEFGSASFGDTAEFYYTTVADDAVFYRASFLGDVTFGGASIKHRALFSSASFAALADFWALQVGETFEASSVGFGNSVYMREAQIGRLDLNNSARPVVIGARFDLRGARIGELHVEDVIFDRDVDVSDARLGEVFVLRFVTFEGDAAFLRTRFAGRVGLENVKFKGEANFADADFSGLAPGRSFEFSYVEAPDFRIRWPQLPAIDRWITAGSARVTSAMEREMPSAGGERPPPTLEPVSRILSGLEDSFRERGQLTDANAAYYQRRLTELGEARASQSLLDRFSLEAEWLFWGAICGYGTNLWRILAWVLLADLAFAAIYWAGATITRRQAPEADHDFSFRLRLTDLPKQFLGESVVVPVPPGRVRKLIDAVRVSSVILLKVGYRDTTLAGRIGRLKIGYVVALEWILGFYLLAALTVTLANTQPLINRLISGIF
jgi:hypothetical protein